MSWLKRLLGRRATAAEPPNFPELRERFAGLKTHLEEVRAAAVSSGASKVVLNRLEMLAIELAQNMETQLQGLRHGIQMEENVARQLDEFESRVGACEQQVGR